VGRDLVAALGALETRRRRAHGRAATERARRLRDLARLLPGPDALLATPRQRLDRAAERAPRALRALASARRLTFARGAAGRFGPGLLRADEARRRVRLETLTARLAPLLARRAARARAEADRLGARLAPRRARRARAQAAARFETLARRLARAGGRAGAAARDRLARGARLLEGFSHHATLARGFAVARDARGAVLTRAAAVKPGAALELEFADGRVKAAADRPAAQGTLF